MKTSNEVDVTSKQCVDVLSEQRKHNRGREFYGLIKHLQDKALMDNDQYYVVDLCSDGHPKNIFWADGRSRDDFTKFGDVVFDVTYMINKFKMLFAPFTVVNHHGQSILFGGALLENEKEETFVWLFEHFLKCMFSKYPNSIITYQDKAMGNAIKKVFPNVQHRFCAWHIKKHELEHLRPYVSRYSDFQESYKEWVMSDTIEEFETRWEVIRDKYKLENNCWITDMYNQRIHWAKAFLKDIFLAGMTISGRSESINSFFDDFVNLSTMLNDFLIQYDKAVSSRRAAKEDEDFKTMNSRPILSSIHPIEAKAGECYTRKVFEIFKKEWIEATSNLTYEALSKSTEEIQY
ncbi:protein FAR1-RELATED SEQUENCE 5-like [Lactuca sativa]|nr:protein FAR1-RELATED SEQUENCE 5-like [Lactuca sativa]